jgi:outer membrane protein assembly factor BamB
VIFRYDRGEVFWVEANPQEFRVTGSFTPATSDGPAWAYPVIHGKHLYLRHSNVLACYDLSAP